MILVFGQTGQVAQELTAYPDVVCLDRSEADLSKPETCDTAIHARKPQAVVNAAAYTAVDRAEEEEALARTVNAETPGAIAKACAARGLPLVHISTDYVFDGSGDEPRAPGAATAPLGAYGRTKLAGEQLAGPDALIVRTAWVYALTGGNFVRTMLRLMAERPEVRVVADQIGTPTYAPGLASALWTMAGKGVSAGHGSQPPAARGPPLAQKKTSVWASVWT